LRLHAITLKAAAKTMIRSYLHKVESGKAIESNEDSADRIFNFNS